MANAIQFTPAQRLAAAWPGFKSICDCGHTGDGCGSEHRDSEGRGDGHGSCKICQCDGFSWRRWVASFGNALHGMIGSRREGVCRGRR